MSVAKKCCFTKTDGTACRAAATASGYCFFHSGKAAEAGRKGGKRRKRPIALPSDAEDIPLATVGQVSHALAVLYNAVYRGQLDSRTGNALCLIAGQLLKAIQGSEIEAELARQGQRIEELLAKIEDESRERRSQNAQRQEIGYRDGSAGNGEQSVPRSNPSGPSGDPEASGDDAGQLARDVAAFFE